MNMEWESKPPDPFKRSRNSMDEKDWQSGEREPLLRS